MSTTQSTSKGGVGVGAATLEGGRRRAEREYAAVQVLPQFVPCPAIIYV